jgi:hypothetical protein
LIANEASTAGIEPEFNPYFENIMREIWVSPIYRQSSFSEEKQLTRVPISQDNSNYVQFQTPFIPVEARLVPDGGVLS